MVYVSTDQRTFLKTERIFRRLCGTLAAKSAVYHRIQIWIAY